MRNGYFYFLYTQIIGCFFDAVKAADFRKFQRLRFLTGDFFIHCAQRSFHDAARGAKNGSRAGTRAERGIKVAGSKILKRNSHVFDEFNKFPSRENNINVRLTAATHFRASCFKFFRGAGHDGDGYNVVRRDSGLFRIVGFGNGAKHAHGRLGCGKMRQQFAIMLLNEIDPAGAAGSDHGKGTIISQTVN